MRRPASPRRGSALVIVLVFLLLVEGLVLATTSSTAPLAQEAWRTEASDQAAALAEAGVAYARRALARDPGFREARDVELGPGRFRVVVQALPDAGYALSSWGAVVARRPAAARGGTIQRGLRVRLERGADGALRVSAWELQ